jgi:replicative superfamily II helicase
VTDLSWLAEHLDTEMLSGADREARRRLAYAALDIDREGRESEDLYFSAETLQLLVEDALDNSRTADATRRICLDAFQLARAQVPVGSDLHSRQEVLRVACIGWMADQGPLARKMLNSLEVPAEVAADAPWDDHVMNQVVDAWILLLRKNSWADIDALLEVIANLRHEQEAREAPFLEAQADEAKPAAWRLVCLYHLAKAAEIAASYLTSGRSDNRFDPREQLDSHFDRAKFAADNSRSISMSNMARLLSYVAAQLLDNSLWMVARSAGPTTTQFVESIVSRSRSFPLFEVLPPQRRALGEEGLARSAQRSVVVSLPTSSGKTLIAQFRILQALSLFESVRGWVAYVVPTRALVNQITSRFRRDFADLGLNVERVSPALEVDGLEAEIMTDANEARQFRILVTTPEKLDLLLRGGWEEKIGRPLCLVVVDEAHNLASERRGVKLELLLATINRESRDAQFLLLTPFIDNAREISAWLDPVSNQAIQFGLEWQPNDRIVALAHRVKGQRRGDFSISLESLATTRKTLSVSEELPLGENRPIGLSWSAAAGPNALAAAISCELERRGPTITLAQTPRFAWSIADTIASNRLPPDPGTLHPDVVVVQHLIAHECGDSYPLVDMLGRGVGVHHSGISDDIRILTEWLLENNLIQHLVATTTVAQGVNFPVANVVFATHQYPYGEVMPPEDFWNIAGRAGRVDQGQVGVIALGAPNPQKATDLRTFVANNVVALTSTLIDMVKTAMQQYGYLDLRQLSHRDEWSAFVQFLAHSYRQIGDHEQFAAEIELLLRGTLGFRSLRAQNVSWANALVTSVRHYAEGLSGKPLSLVDSTGFSWESVSATLGRLSVARITPDAWQQQIYGPNRRTLRDMIGVMLQVPELRENLQDGAGGAPNQGSFLAEVIGDWVNGMPLPQLAETYFKAEQDDLRTAITKCSQRLFNKIAPTVAWGMSAIQSLTLRDAFNDASQDEQRRLRNLPSFAYYGVNSEAAVAACLLGVPRTAASALASTLLSAVPNPPTARGSDESIREKIRASTSEDWVRALGERGQDYFRAWKILEGTV